MSAVVILVSLKTVRFSCKDKSENTFIKYVCRGYKPNDITKLVKVSQITTLFGVLFGYDTKKAEDYTLGTALGLIDCGRVPLSLKITSSP